MHAKMIYMCIYKKMYMQCTNNVAMHNMKYVLCNNKCNVVQTTIMTNANYLHPQLQYQLSVQAYTPIDLNY